VQAQRLVRRICNDCGEPHTITADEEQILQINAAHYPQVRRGKGCERCGETGYRGRIGLYELLVMSDTIRHEIAIGSDSNVIRAQAIKEGMKTLRQDALEKLAAGMTTPEEVVRVTRAGAGI
jgi:general secretion pathway protein E